MEDELLYLRKLIHEELKRELNEAQEGDKISWLINFYVENFMPMTLPQVDWHEFHLKPSEYAKETVKFLKDSFTAILNRIKESNTEPGNFYVFPSKALHIKTDTGDQNLSFLINDYKNPYFAMQEKVFYNSFVFFVYRDAIIDIIPINTFMHNNDNLLYKAAEKYIRMHRFNFDRKGENNKIIIDKDFVNLGLTLNFKNYEQDKKVPINQKLKKSYRAGSKMEFPGYGVGIIQSVKKIGKTASDNLLYQLQVLFPEFNKTKTFQVAQKQVV